MDEEQGTGVSSPAYPLTGEVSERLRVVLSEAEDAARAIRAEAEDESRNRLKSAADEAAEIVAEARRQADALVEERVRRISELSDALTAGAENLVGGVEHAQAVRSQFDELIGSLSRVAEELSSETGSSEPIELPAPRERRFARTPEPEPESESESESESEPAAVAAETNGDAAPEASDDSDRGAGEEHLGARLVAFQMAVAGGSRGEVDGHLRRAFELDPADWILDDIFGPDTGPDARVSWAEASAQPAQS